MSAWPALGELPGGLVQQPRLVMLMVLLLAAAVIDWRHMRIPNALTLGGALAGLLLSVLSPASQVSWPLALAGLALGLLVMLPMHVLGVMGAGDVKLMAMAGVYLGVPDTLQAVLFVFVTGGVLALATVLWRRAWGPLLRNLRDLLRGLGRWPQALARPEGLLARAPSVGKLPYGVSICAGTWVYVLAQQLGHI